MSNPIFGTYACYYNLLYKDKDYAAEARYVHGLIQSHCPAAKTVLNLGCGTGNHDFELVKLGYEITGVDMSEEMLSAANSRFASINSQPTTDLLHSSGSCSFLPGDIRTVRFNKTFDVVISLFHVMSYQTTNADLLAAIATAKKHLSPGGVFIFDCWYGPGVLSDPPVTRVKVLSRNGISLTRIAEPVLHPNENVVDVNYRILLVDDETNHLVELTELHRMRYLFTPEIELILEQCDMKLLKNGAWLSEQPADLFCWNAYFVCIHA
jgi:SAM-dependent methyltransferase